MTTSQPRTLAEDLRSRDDADLTALLTARPDLIHPIPSDMRALTTRASTSPSIARYLDDIDVLHHYTLRVACELTATEPTTTKAIVDHVTRSIDKKARRAVEEAVAELWRSALLWGSADHTHVVTAVRDQVMNAPTPTWPPPAHGGGDATSAPPSGVHVGAQARATLSVIEEVGDLWRREPGSVLRSGGLSTRSFDALVGHLGVDETTLRICLDVAQSAGLLAVGATETDLGWMPTSEFEQWRGLPAARRWAALAKEWRVRNAITGDRPLLTEEHPFIETWRRHLLEVLGEGSCPLRDAIEVIDYRWPRRAGDKRRSVLEVLWAEATTLGVIDGDQLTTPGSRLASGGDAASLAKAMAPYLPPEIDHVLVQADHTIVAPGPLTPEMGRILREIADVESRGQGFVLRITNASVSRALEVESDPDILIAQLAECSSTKVPQPVAYLITDAARNAPPACQRFTAPTPPSSTRRSRKAATPASVEKAIRVLRAQEVRERFDTATNVDDVPRMDSSAVVASLRYAIDHNETVHLTHAESDGTTAVLLIDPIRLGGGSLTAYDHHSEQVRTLAVSRISGVLAIQLSA